MPIKSLESYLFERRLVNTSSIEVIKNATIGIDVEHYLSRIYTFKKEQFLAAVGGVPSSLRDYIQSDLQVFQEFNIKPIFVIKGLDIQTQVANYQTNELSSNEQHLQHTWNKLSSRDANYNYSNNDSFRLFTDPLPLRPMINDLIKYFIESGIDYIVCPYDASFQLSYLYQNKIIDTIYGSTDLLLTKVNKFILGMEFQSKDFRFIDKNKVLYELNISSKQLLDLSIMVGCNLQPTTLPNLPSLPKPNPLQPYPQLSYFKLGLDILYQYINFVGDPQTGLYQYILSLNDQRCLDLYTQGHSAFRYIPILNEEGYVTLYNSEIEKLGLLDSEDGLFEQVEQSTDEDEEKPSIVKVPNDVHSIISQRLPPELYFYQSIGLAPIELLEAITQGQLNIRLPQEGGLNESYRKLINSRFYTENLDSLFNLITQLLARYYQVKKIKVLYWYKDDGLELNNRMIPPVSRKISHLLYKDDTSKNFSLVHFFKSLETKYPKTPSDVKLTSANDIISTAVLRSLYMHGLISDKTDELTSYGKILQKFVKENEAKLDATTLQELVLLLFFIKADCYKFGDISRDFSNVARNFKDPGASDAKLEEKESQHISLLSRIFSVHRFKIAPINYQGPVSRSLLNFRSHLKFISTNLIYNIQACLIDLITRQEHNDIKISLDTKDDWYKLVDQIPFFNDLNNTLLGVVAEIYFDYSVRQSKLNRDLSKQQIIENSKEHLLSNVYQINNPIFNINVHGVNSVTSNQLFADFSNGVEFWSLFVKLIQLSNEVDKSIVSDAFLKQVEEADVWLKQFI